MPSYFKLLRRTDQQAESFNEVDRKICEHFSAICDEVNWFHWWYPLIMEWGIACGRDFAKQRKDTLDELAKCWKKRADEEIIGLRTTLEIIDWLDTNYVAEAWYASK